MRDTIKTEEYWTNHLNILDKRIKKMESWLLEESNPDTINRIRIRLEQCRFDFFVSMYSSGVDLSLCKRVFEENVTHIKDCWNDTFSFNDLLWYVSIAFLFQTESSTTKNIYAMYLSSKIRDSVLETILKKMLPEVSVSGQVFDEIVELPFLNMLSDKTKQTPEYIDTVLNTIWYSSHKDAPWYNSDKLSNDNFNGYWSFEMGAFAKVFEINDSTLQNTPFYPYDLVHFAD